MTKGEAASQAANMAAKTAISISEGFSALLSKLGISLAFTSYQTGQLILVGCLPGGQISLNQQNFDHAMGLAWQGRRLYLATQTQIWRFEDLLNPGETGNTVHDAILVPRSAHTTGDLDVHEIGISQDGAPLLVATRFNCLAALDSRFSFSPIWKPPFVSEIAKGDRCHLNGLAMQNGVPHLVTVIGESSVVDGWKSGRRAGGQLLSVPDGKVVARDLSMPHSPRIANDIYYLLESGRGHLVRIEPGNGRKTDVTFCPGFARGLAIHGDHAFVTLSKPRDDQFSGLPLDDELTARHEQARCGVMVIDLRSGTLLEWMYFEGRIRELFDIAVLPGVRCPTALGPGTEEIRSNIRVGSWKNLT